MENAWKTTTYVLAVLLAIFAISNARLASKLAVASASGSATNSESRTGQADTNAAANNSPAHITAAEGAVLGSKRAKVEVVAFVDYECPFCRRFYQESFRHLQRDYIATGKVRFVTRDYPLAFHSRANSAAVAASCVRRLAHDDAFYEYQDALFSQGKLSDVDLRKAAIQLGIEGTTFNKCIADKDHSIEKRIDEDRTDAQAAGVIGTPTLFVNGRIMVGAQPYAAFKSAIDAELKKVNPAS